MKRRADVDEAERRSRVVALLRKEILTSFGRAPADVFNEAVPGDSVTLGPEASGTDAVAPSQSVRYTSGTGSFSSDGTAGGSGRLDKVVRSPGWFSRAVLDNVRA